MPCVHTPLDFLDFWMIWLESIEHNYKCQASSVEALDPVITRANPIGGNLFLPLYKPLCHHCHEWQFCVNYENLD